MDSFCNSFQITLALGIAIDNLEEIDIVMVVMDTIKFITKALSLFVNLASNYFLVGIMEFTIPET